MREFLILIFVSALVLVSVIMMIALRYKKCSSDQILVVFGKVGREKSAKCIHGGAQFILPFFQDYKFLSLRPMQIEINLTGALSKQNIRINTPSTYTIGISTEPGVMRNAAERLLSMTHKDIESTAREIIFGQQRLVIASMQIEEINTNRDLFLQKIKENVESELNKIGLRLINVNITDITDEEGYLEALGKKAASEVTNRAMVEVAEQDKIGAMGKAEADRDRRIAISLAEAEASKGEAEAEKLRRLSTASSEADAVKGESAFSKDQRISIKESEALAIQGENKSSMDIAKSIAERSVVEEEARRRTETAKAIANANIKSAAYEAEKDVQIKKAEMVKEKERAERIIPAEVEKMEKEIQASADAEITRLRASGEADAKLSELHALAKGEYDLLKSKAEGFSEMIKSCNNDPNAAAKMMMVEKVEALVKAQAEAIKNIKFDKVVVWDNGSGTDGGNSTSKFLSGMINSLPPLHDIAKTAGIDLPNFLGKSTDEKESPKEKQSAEDSGETTEKV